MVATNRDDLVAIDMVGLERHDYKNGLIDMKRRRLSTN